MKVLLTGGAGFLGSILSRLLLEHNHTVRVLDNLLFGVEPIRDLLDNNRFHLFQGDVRHIDDVIAAMADIDAVIDLAALVGAPACDRNHEVSIATNFWATKLLADVATKHNARRFLFASTCSVYGANDGRILSESDPTNPLSVYAKTKLQSEQALLETNSNLEPVVLRLSTLCGSSHRMRFDLVLNIMTATAYVDNQVKVLGGEQWRPLMDVRDAARAFCMLLENDSSDVSHTVFNIGSNHQNLRIRDLADLVISEVDGAEVVEFPNKKDPRSYRVTFDKIRKAGFKPQIALNRSVIDVKEMLEKRIIDDYRLPQYSNSQWDYPEMRV